MTVDELYEYITEYMTPEEALKKLLEGSLRSYEKLKFDKGEEVHPVFIISMVAMDMNWQIAFSNESEDIEGLVIGTKDYMQEIFKE